MYRLITTALVAVGAVALLPDRGDAQVRFRANVGGIQIGNMPFYGGYGYGANQPFGYGSNFYNPTWGYGNRFYTSPGYYNSISGYYGTPGFYTAPRYYSAPSYYYSTPGYYSTPSYYYVNPAYSYSNTYSSSPQYAQASFSGGAGYQSYYPSAGTPAGNTARVEVRVPAPDAEVWFDGTATQQRGTVRTYESPELTGGRSYSYQVRARWTENGETRDQTRTVPVTPGQQATVDFTRPEQGGN